MAKGKYHKWLTEEGLLLIEGWKREGLSDKQIAEGKIGVSERTLEDWKVRFPAVSSVLKKGKEIVIREVENALLKRAKGYDYTEETQELKFIKGEAKLVVTKVVMKHMPPDVGAAAFYLKNADPTHWRDRIPAATQEVQDAEFADAWKQQIINGFAEEGNA